jgi:hypothetical protein
LREEPVPKGRRFEYSEIWGGWLGRSHPIPWRFRRPCDARPLSTRHQHFADTLSDHRSTIAINLDPIVARFVVKTIVKAVVKAVSKTVDRSVAPASPDSERLVRPPAHAAPMSRRSPIRGAPPCDLKEWRFTAKEE